MKQRGRGPTRPARPVEADTKPSTGTSWHGALETAAKICASLPADKVGTCVISIDGELFRGDPENLRAALANDNVAYHEGSIGGSWPRLIATA